jgi:hypothetical protein
MANFLLNSDKELSSKVDVRLQLVLLNTIRVAERKHGINEVKRCANTIAEANYKALEEINFEYTEDTHQVLSVIILSLGDNMKKLLALELSYLLDTGSIVDVSATNVGLFLNMYSKLSDSLNLPLDIASKVFYRQAKKEPKIKQKRAKSDTQNRANQKKVIVKKKKLPRKLKIKRQIEDFKEKLASCPAWAEKAWKRKIELLEAKI